MQYQQHALQLQATLQPHQALLLSHPNDVVYCTGFEYLVPEEREAFFVITKQNFYLIRASFSPVPAHAFFQVLDNCKPASVARHLANIVKDEQMSEILFDKSSLFYEEYEAILDEATTLSCTLRSFDRNLIWNFRLKKSDDEVKYMRQAGRIMAQAMQAIIAELHSGMTEKHVCHLLTEKLTSLGSDKNAFPLIVAFGAHGAEPHYQPGDAVLEDNMPVLIDAGATVKGYRSDMTRSFWFGAHPTEEFLKIEKIVQAAYTAAFEKLSSSQRLKALDLDQAARSLIKTAGFEEYFIHTTGHGIGLDIHEPPSLNWSNETPIEPSMVITIEPGIYLEDTFGYRHENTVLVTEKGGEVLTKI